MTRESEFFRTVAERASVRVRVAAIVIQNDHLLVQRPTDDPAACYALIGGAYEVGDTFDTRIRREFAEETTAHVVAWTYRFVVENRFRVGDAIVYGLEHYLEVQLDRTDVHSNEPHLAQHWLPLKTLNTHDLRPHVVRDAIASDQFRHVKHLVVDL